MGFFYAHTYRFPGIRKMIYKKWRLPFPLHFCFRAESVRCLTTRELAAVFLPNCQTSHSNMKNQVSGTLNVPASGMNAASESVNALTEQVSDLQRRYYSSLAPDCELRSASDRWYFGAILSTCIGFIFPPLFAVTALCVYKAKKCRKGGAE